ncbi:hypothetical protein [Hymenobacter crusticola]|nr:hypothetical protein [Hymenobacter crusticola]
MGESDRRMQERKATVLNSLISTADSNERDASYLSIFIFSGKRGLLKSIAPKKIADRRADRDPLLQTVVGEYAKLRESNQPSHYNSEDSEMLGLRPILECFGGIVARLKQEYISFFNDKVNQVLSTEETRIKQNYDNIRLDIQNSSTATKKTKEKHRKQANAAEKDELATAEQEARRVVEENLKSGGNYATEFVTEKGDELRVEMVGPQGTCGDCQAAINQFVTDLKSQQMPFPKEAIKVSFNTRWLFEKKRAAKSRQNVPERSPYYGSDQAYDAKSYRQDVRHWKLRYN